MSVYAEYRAAKTEEEREQAEWDMISEARREAAYERYCDDCDHDDYFANEEEGDE